MPTTLSYGYIKPVDGDAASSWFDSIESTITQLNSHDHDGVDSSLIAAKNVTAGTATASSGSWGSAVSTGVYRQTVTLPTGFTYDNSSIEVRNSSGNVVYATVEKVSSSSCYVYTGDNTQSYTLYFK